jgi:preprotein translocase subunit SecE
VKIDQDGVPEDDGRDEDRDRFSDAASDADDVRDDAAEQDDDRADVPGLGRLAVEEREPAAVGARVPAGSARAAARASAARTGVTPAKGRATPTRDRGPRRGNIFVRIARYLREVVAEMRKVIWPTRKEMITYTIVVIVFLVFMIALVWALDFGFAKAVLEIFG